MYHLDKSGSLYIEGRMLLEKHADLLCFTFFPHSIMALTSENGGLQFLRFYSSFSEIMKEEKKSYYNNSLVRLFLQVG